MQQKSDGLAEEMRRVTENALQQRAREAAFLEEQKRRDDCKRQEAERKEAQVFFVDKFRELVLNVAARGESCISVLISEGHVRSVAEGARTTYQGSLTELLKKEGFKVESRLDSKPSVSDGFDYDYSKYLDISW